MVNMKLRMMLACLALIVGPLSAREAAVPDFSHGLPGVKLERNEKANGNEIFHLLTGLDSKAFEVTLGEFLGAGWRTRKLGQEEIRFAASKGRFTNYVVHLVIYENPKVPGVTIRVLYLDSKQEGAGSRVEIAMLSEGQSE